MRSSARANFWLGLVFGGIVAAAILFSVYYVPRKGLSFGADELAFTVVLEEAHGLHAGSPVLISGVEAGEVTGVEISQLPHEGWRVLAAVEVFDGARFGRMLTTGSVFQVAKSGLLGEVTLAISPGGAGDPVAGQLVKGTPPTDLSQVMDDLAVISKRAADFMDGREVGDPSLKRTLVDLQEAIRKLRDFIP